MAQGTDLSNDSGYYKAREAEERRLAMAAKDPNARGAHLELAEQYAKLAETGAARPQIVNEPQRA